MSSGIFIYKGKIVEYIINSIMDEDTKEESLRKSISFIHNGLNLGSREVMNGGQAKKDFIIKEFEKGIRSKDILEV